MRLRYEPMLDVLRRHGFHAHGKFRYLQADSALEADVGLDDGITLTSRRVIDGTTEIHILGVAKSPAQLAALLNTIHENV